ncbi:unnamed protein product [Oikopleura dioica]|uniref:Homeobox domain-containing protein n=1 Tax=Oikopleura dioica TaxID=34765 RepID=E4YFJ0_OIKDI|nr:unnamed protein product [Oikopleura dioica]
MTGTRTKFDDIEIAALNEIFEMYNQYPNRRVMENMAEILDKPPLVVKNWFRNKRKTLHWRKNKRHSPKNDNYPPDSACSVSPGTASKSASPPAQALTDSDNEIPSIIAKQEIQEEESLALVSTLPPIDSAEQSNLSIINIIKHARTISSANYSESDYEDRSPNPDYPSPDNFVFYPESPEGLRSNDNSPRTSVISRFKRIKLAQKTTRGRWKRDCIS